MIHYLKPGTLPALEWTFSKISHHNQQETTMILLCTLSLLLLTFGAVELKNALEA